MKSFAIGSLTLIANNVAAPGFILQTPITGLESPNYRMGTYARIGQDGGVVSSMFYDNRVVQLTGTIWADNPLDFETRRVQFEQACAINKDSNGYPLPTRVTFTTLAGTNLYFDAYIDKPLMNYDQPNFAKFLVTLTATNPFLFSPNTISSGQMFAPIGGGFLLPVVLPIVSSAASGGSIIINNPGNVALFPKIVFNGLLTNPIITNRTTGKSMQLNYTLATGNTAEIDMREHAITLNQSSSLNGTKSSLSDWWSLAVGDNTVVIGSASTSDTGYAILTGNPAYTGI